jgi:hypothetical protein
MFSSEEEDDKELLIALDKWIGLVNSFKEKQKNQQDCIGKAGEDTTESYRIQENLGCRWSQKQRTPSIEASDTSTQLIDNQDSSDPFVEPLGSTLQLLASSTKVSLSSQATSQAPLSQTSTKQV